MKEPQLSHTQQKYPPQIPLVLLKDVCLGPTMKIPASKVLFFHTKTLSSSESGVGTDVSCLLPSYSSLLGNLPFSSKQAT